MSSFARIKAAAESLAMTQKRELMRFLAACAMHGRRAAR